MTRQEVEIRMEAISSILRHENYRIEREEMVRNSREVGAYLKEQLQGLMGDHPIIGDVRGIGLLQAETAPPATD